MDVEKKESCVKENANTYLPYPNAFSESWLLNLFEKGLEGIRFSLMGKLV